MTVHRILYKGYVLSARAKTVFATVSIGKQGQQEDCCCPHKKMKALVWTAGGLKKALIRLAKDEITWCAQRKVPNAPIGWSEYVGKDYGGGLWGTNLDSTYVLADSREEAADQLANYLGASDK